MNIKVGWEKVLKVLDLQPYVSLQERNDEIIKKLSKRDIQKQNSKNTGQIKLKTLTNYMKVS